MSSEQHSEIDVDVLVRELRGEPFQIVRLLQGDGWSRMEAMRITARAIERRNFDDVRQERCS